MINHRTRVLRLLPQRLRVLLILFALSLTMPLLVLAAFGLNRMAETERSAIEERVLQAAQVLAADLDREFDRAFVTLETLATSDALKDGDLGAFHAQALLALRPAKAAIALIDTTHQQLMDTLKPYGTDLPPTADPETAKRVIDTNTRQISNLFKGSISGRPVFNVEVPVTDASGVVRFVLIMSFQAAYVADLLKAAKFPRPWISGVTDRNGIIVARSERHEDYVGKPLPVDLFAQSKEGFGTVYRATNVAGDRILRGTVRSAHSGWYVSATVPVAHVDAPHVRTYWFAGVLLSAAIALCGLLAVLFGQLMARPLEMATQLAEAVGAGERVLAKSSAMVEANVLMETLANASAELNRRHEQSEFLTRELAHRAKNQLAVVRGMAQQTARKSDGLDDFAARFDQRLQGLAQSQDLLLEQNWRGAWLGDLITAQLEPFAMDGRIEVSGCPIFLDPGGVQNLGYALHELATNATKHGALTATTGRILITWIRHENGKVHLEWKEEGGMPTRSPSTKGFGWRVIMDLVPKALDGTATCNFESDGLRWKVEFPAPHMGAA